MDKSHFFFIKVINKKLKVELEFVRGNKVALFKMSASQKQQKTEAAKNRSGIFSLFIYFDCLQIKILAANNFF